MEKFVKAVGAITLLLLFALLMAWPVQLLWNDFFVTVLKLPAITFWQGVELSVLCSLLFKGK